MKFLLTLRMKDGSKKEIEGTGKTLSEVFSSALDIKDAEEIIRSERVGEVNETAFVSRDGQGLYDSISDRRWVKAKVPNAPNGEEHHDPLDWHVEVDEDGRRIPGYWVYYPQDDRRGTVMCVVG